MSSQLTKLKFRVVFCSSEDNEFPVTQLLNHGPHSTGWQSARFQDFPQIMILQFVSPVRIQQLQFLSHQSKIATRIELFTYLPENPSSIPPLENFKWNRLGYLSLDNNEKSGFQARELKSVYIESQSLFLKVSLNKCHVNKYNIFNQVGLIAVNCLGDELGNMKGPAKGIQPRLENEMEFDSATNDRIKQLYAAKDRAIENEDFDEAKRIKDAVERLKSVGYELLMLEDRKRNAIANEDYDSAKILKIEIERMRNAVLPPMPDTYFAPVQQSSHRPFSGGPQPLGIGRPISRPQPSQFPPPQQLGDATSYDQFERRGNQMLPEPRGKVNHDEQVIPTMKNGKGPGQIFAQNNYEEEENMPPNLDNPPEPLGVQQSKQADPLLPILGEDICRRIFSKTWQFREDGLGIIQTEVQKGGSSEIFGGSDNANIYSGVLGAVRYTVGDKVAQVSLKSMGLVNVLLNSVAPSRSILRGDVPEHIQNIMVLLLDKIGDNNARVRELAEQTYISLARSDIVGAGPAVQSILKPMKDKSTSQKHNIGRLNLLDSIVKEFQIDNSYVPFGPVAEYALNGFKNTSQDIRNAAYNLLMSIYMCVGPKLQPYFADLRPAQMEMIEKGIQELESGGGPSITVQAAPRQQNLAPPKRKNSNAVSIPFCQYCGKKDSIFGNEDNLDIHYWKDCPMLVSCQMCNQVIEILHLNTHMLKECELKNVNTQCPRCKEAVHMDEYEQHIEEQSCYAAKPPKIASRCPLCHEDVDPGVEGWKNHILTQGCPNNDRSNI